MMSFLIFFDISFEPLNVSLYLFKTLFLSKDQQHLRKFITNRVNILVAGISQKVNLVNHMLFSYQTFVNSVIQPFVHSFFRLTEPSKQIWFFLHLSFEIFVIKKGFVISKLLENVRNVRTVKWNWIT
jgi:hypothetical protein